jgi:hypothetical protein
VPGASHPRDSKWDRNPASIAARYGRAAARVVTSVPAVRPATPPSSTASSLVTLAPPRTVVTVNLRWPPASGSRSS